MRLARVSSFSSAGSWKAGQYQRMREPPSRAGSRPIGGDIKSGRKLPTSSPLIHFCSPYRTFREAGNSRRLSTALSRVSPLLPRLYFAIVELGKEFTSFSFTVSDIFI
ncbi:hypothetical protein CEXT_396911 [Caerostris extrusa]|uniref:Uncharacterized protein n=1 Tax=Caerostris extrusa TaxID=172846 RepID=A0AAV4Q9Y9_CAEEX|nr:hypothetical protein CEXT_396911 [Caerostris extrusa]